MRRAQSTLEYTMGIIVFIAALLAMQIYLKRGMEGNFRSSADSIGSQYSPKNTSSLVTTKNNSSIRSETKTKETTDNKLEITTITTTDYDTTEVSGSETVSKLDTETLFDKKKK